MFASLTPTITIQVTIEEAWLIHAALEVIDPDSELASTQAEDMVNTLNATLQEVG